MKGDCAKQPELPTCVPILLGRGCLSSDGNVAYHFFGAIRSLGATYPLFTKKIAIAKDICRTRCGVVRIAIAGPEFQRSGEGPFSPLPQAVFALPGSQIPAGASFSPRSQLQVMVSFYDGSPCPRELYFDIGQTIELVTDCCVSVFLVMPVGINQVLTDGPLAPPLTPPVSVTDAFVLDAWIKIGIWELEAPIGALGGHYSNFITVPAEETVSFPIPDGAQEVQIFQTSLGAAALNFTEWYGDPNIVANAQENAVISFEPGLRETAIKRVNNATHIRSDIDNETDREFKVVWRIES